MSTNPTDINPNWAQPQQPAKRGNKVLSCLLIGCGGVLLLCCGGGIGIYFYFKSWMSDDPQQIAATQSEIVQIDVPASLRPAMSMNMKIPFMGELGSAVVYLDQSSQSSLMLLAVNRKFAEQEGNDLKGQMEQAMREQGFKGNQHVNIHQSSDRDFTIGGKKVTFHFGRGKSGQSGREVLIVTGTFDGKMGPTVFTFTGDPNEYDDEAVARIIESIP